MRTSFSTSRRFGIASSPANRGLVVVDTNVLVYLSQRGRWAGGYRELLNGRPLGLSFQVEAELLEYPRRRQWAVPRSARLASLLAACVMLLHAYRTSELYADVAITRHGTRNGAGDGDVWVIAQALEYDAALASHDRQMSRLAGAMGLEVLSMLPDA